MSEQSTLVAERIVFVNNHITKFVHHSISRALCQKDRFFFTVLLSIMVSLTKVSQIYNFKLLSFNALPVVLNWSITVGNMLIISNYPILGQHQSDRHRSSLHRSGVQKKWFRNEMRTTLDGHILLGQYPTFKWHLWNVMLRNRLFCTKSKGFRSKCTVEGKNNKSVNKLKPLVNCQI